MVEYIASGEGFTVFFCRLGNAIAGFQAIEDRDQVVNCPKSHGVASIVSSAADVGQKEDIVQFAVARMDFVGFTVVHVESGGGTSMLDSPGV